MDFTRTHETADLPEDSAIDLARYIPYMFNLSVENDDPGPFAGQRGSVTLQSDGTIKVENYAAIAWYYAGLRVTSPDWPMLTLLLRCHQEAQ